MVVAGGKHLDKFAWGEVEKYHTVEFDGKRFLLFQWVTITTKDSQHVTGEIGNISESSVDILVERRSIQTIKFADIENITC